MSRIHEALKKAERERVSLYGDFAPDSGPQKEVEIRQESTQVSVPALTQRKILAGDLLSNLRFEDLQARCVQQWQADPQANVFTSGLSPKAAEQFRTLRSRLYHYRRSQPLRKLLITSAIPGEGKTFLATNLGYAIARQQERRVLLIDADLRHSRMHKSLGTQRSPGLTDYLRGEIDELGAIRYSPENNLCFIAAGGEVSNPSELLSNGRLATLLERAAGLFEWIIVDSPPSVPVADASMLAGHCDALVFVVRALLTPASVVKKGLKELQGIKVVGVVLNAVEEDTLGYGYYHPAYGEEYVSAVET